jgi:tRNA(adenine34) deaminase
MLQRDEYWMQCAIKQASQAESQGEVPVGAVLVKDDELIASGFNQPIQDTDPTAHAEIVVLRRAANIINNYRIPGTTLYVTLEPCAMCAGAIMHARIERVVFGAYDARAGAVQSVFQLFDETRLNHHVAYCGAVLQDQCSNQMKEFFRNKRKK